MYMQDFGVVFTSLYCRPIFAHLNLLPKVIHSSEIICMYIINVHDCTCIYHIQFHQLRHLEFKKEKKKEHYQNIQEAEYQIHYYNNVCCPL